MFEPNVLLIWKPIERLMWNFFNQHYFGKRVLIKNLYYCIVFVDLFLYLSKLYIYIYIEIQQYIYINVILYSNKFVLPVVYTKVENKTPHTIINAKTNFYFIHII